MVNGISVGCSPVSLVLLYMLCKQESFQSVYRIQFLCPTGKDITLASLNPMGNRLIPFTPAAIILPFYKTLKRQA